MPSSSRSDACKQGRKRKRQSVQNGGMSPVIQWEPEEGESSKPVRCKSFPKTQPFMPNRHTTFQAPRELGTHKIIMSVRLPSPENHLYCIT